MKTIKIEMKGREYSTLYFATKLVSEVCKYSSEVILKSVSENKISQEVDLKSILGVTAILSNKADTLEIELHGEDELSESSNLEKMIPKLLDESVK